MLKRIRPWEAAETIEVESRVKRLDTGTIRYGKFSREEVDRGQDVG